MSEFFAERYQKAFVGKIDPPIQKSTTKHFTEPPIQIDDFQEEPASQFHYSFVDTRPDVVGELQDLHNTIKGLKPLHEPISEQPHSNPIKLEQPSVHLAQQGDFDEHIELKKLLSFNPNQVVGVKLRPIPEHVKPEAPERPLHDQIVKEANRRSSQTKFFGATGRIIKEATFQKAVRDGNTWEQTGENSFQLLTHTKPKKKL